MRGNYLLMLLGFVLLGCNTYTVSYKPESRNISVVIDSVRIYADISLKPFTDELKNDRQYYWYSSDLIAANYGGFNGNLLNGTFKKVNLTGILLEKGTFSNGLKNGIWKYWYANGNLKRVEKWNKGVVNGNILEYDKDGALINAKAKTIIPENQTQPDSTVAKTPWHKRIFKKNKKEPEVNGAR
jgi:hypothetical protein